MSALILSMLFSTLRTSSPILFAALGGLFSERSGIINIALEAYLLVGAFAAAVTTLSTGSPWAGLLVAAALTALFSLLYGAFVITAKANQIVVGTAMNFLAMGTIPFALKILYDSTGASPAVPFESRFQSFPLWLLAACVPLVWLIMRRLPFGQWVSFAGENPDALASAGISVRRIRFCALAVAGALAGMGGACLSIFLASGYSRNMAAGRGFIALAALIFGKWKPFPTAAACLFFGFMEAVQVQMQAAQITIIPSQFIQIIPYLATLFVLAGFVGHSRAPKALGRPF